MSKHINNLTKIIQNIAELKNRWYIVSILSESL